MPAPPPSPPRAVPVCPAVTPPGRAAALLRTAWMDACGEVICKVAKVVAKDSALVASAAALRPGAVMVLARMHAQHDSINCDINGSHFTKVCGDYA